MSEGKDNFGHRFRIIHNSIDKYFSRCWEGEERELTRAQCATLHYLYDHRNVDVFQKDIEAAFLISGATASNILKGLERQGIVRRVAVKEDARLKRILMTEDGIHLHERAIDNIERMEKAISKGMTEEEAIIYRRLLDISIQNIEELSMPQADSEMEK